MVDRYLPVCTLYSLALLEFLFLLSFKVSVFSVSLERISFQYDPVICYKSALSKYPVKTCVKTKQQIFLSTFSVLDNLSHCSCTTNKVDSI